MVQPGHQLADRALTRRHHCALPDGIAVALDRFVPFLARGTTEKRRGPAWPAAGDPRAARTASGRSAAARGAPARAPRSAVEALSLFPASPERTGEGAGRIMSEAPGGRAC